MRARTEGFQKDRDQFEDMAHETVDFSREMSRLPEPAVGPAGGALSGLRLPSRPLLSRPNDSPERNRGPLRRSFGGAHRPPGQHQPRSRCPGLTHSGRCEWNQGVAGISYFHFSRPLPKLHRHRSRPGGTVSQGTISEAIPLGPGSRRDGA